MKKIWTGERLETFIYNTNTIEHLHRYFMAMNFVKNKIVLDIASGEGYGTNLLSKFSKKVYGVDISEETISHSKAKYSSANIEFKVGSASLIPIPDHSIDVVVSFETIEHHDQHEEMLNEILRVLKKDGILIISSPDKKYYSDIPKYKNPFHVKELYEIEFKALIKKKFIYTTFYYQKALFGSLIVNENDSPEIVSFKGSYDGLELLNSFHGIYNICIASNLHINNFPTNVFDGSDIFNYQIEEAKELVRKSWSYKLGNALLFPLRFITKL